MRTLSARRRTSRKTRRAKLSNKRRVARGRAAISRKSRTQIRRKQTKSRRRVRQRGSGFLGDIKNSVTNTFSGLYKRITGKSKDDAVNDLDNLDMNFSSYDSPNTAYTSTVTPPSASTETMFPLDSSKTGQIGGLPYYY